MRMSFATAARLRLAIACLGQEAAFGHKPQLSDAVVDIADIPFDELTEQQAERLIADAKTQREVLFKEEAQWQ